MGGGNGRIIQRAADGVIEGDEAVIRAREERVTWDCEVGTQGGKGKAIAFDMFDQDSDLRKMHTGDQRPGTAQKIIGAHIVSGSAIMKALIA